MSASILDPTTFSISHSWLDGSDAFVLLACAVFLGRPLGFPPAVFGAGFGFVVELVWTAGVFCFLEMRALTRRCGIAFVDSLLRRRFLLAGSGVVGS